MIPTKPAGRFPMLGPAAGAPRRPVPGTSRFAARLASRVGAPFTSRVRAALASRVGAPLGSPFGLMAVMLAFAALVVGCSSAPTTTPPVSPGTSARPREVNIVARDDVFSPPAVDLVPGETVLLHVINGGLESHEAVIGDQQVQDAWEIAEANVPPTRPGVTPAVSVPPGLEGLRVVVRSGQRMDVTWTVPQDPSVVGRLIVGCHVPGHYAKGMHVPVRVATTVAP